VVQLEDDPARGAAVDVDVEEDVGRHGGILSRCCVLAWTRPGSPAMKTKLRGSEGGVVGLPAAQQAEAACRGCY
ncbi:hypothetical protein ACPCVO_51170, partial [Streptomyces umbrinus]|uniref:hypothetical protein n=1 Tax=Streptomyces umbrinus TaxID=67370 RepID=UPI003C2C3FD2